jgi:hypothetical protein
MNISMYKIPSVNVYYNAPTAAFMERGALKISVRVPLGRSRQSQRAAVSRLLKNQVSSFRVMAFATIPSQIAAR